MKVAINMPLSWHAWLGDGGRRVDGPEMRAAVSYARI